MRLQTSLINYSLCSVPFLFHSAQVQQHGLKVEGMLKVAGGGGGEVGGGALAFGGGAGAGGGAAEALPPSHGVY